MPPNAFPLPEYHRWRPVSGLRRGHPIDANQGPIQTGERLSARASSIITVLVLLVAQAALAIVNRSIESAWLRRCRMDAHGLRRTLIVRRHIGLINFEVGSRETTDRKSVV